MGLFGKKSALPRVAPEISVPPVAGGIEEALVKLAQDPTFDLESFLELSTVTFLSLRGSLWASDREGVLELVTKDSRLVTLVTTTYQRQRRTHVEGFTLLSTSLVRAPDSGRALTVRFHYTSSSESLVHLTSGAVFERSAGSHHKEDVTFVQEDGQWRVSALSIIS